MRLIVWKIVCVTRRSDWVVTTLARKSHNYNRTYYALPIKRLYLSIGTDGLFLLLFHLDFPDNACRLFMKDTANSVWSSWCESLLDYPWRFPNSTTDSNVVKWLYVPDFKTKPDSFFLFCMWYLWNIWICLIAPSVVIRGPLLVLLFFLSSWLHTAAVCLPPEAGLWRWEQGSHSSNGWRQCGNL